LRWRMLTVSAVRVLRGDAASCRQVLVVVLGGGEDLDELGALAG
jgi:hypothetical protein